MNVPFVCVVHVAFHTVTLIRIRVKNTVHLCKRSVVEYCARDNVVREEANMAAINPVTHSNRPPPMSPPSPPPSNAPYGGKPQRPPSTGPHNARAPHTNSPGSSSVSLQSPQECQADGKDPPSPTPQLAPLPEKRPCRHRWSGCRRHCSKRNGRRRNRRKGHGRHSKHRSGSNDGGGLLLHRCMRHSKCA